MQKHVEKPCWVLRVGWELNLVSRWMPGHTTSDGTGSPPLTPSSKQRPRLTIVRRKRKWEFISKKTKGVVPEEAKQEFSHEDRTHRS